MWNAAHYFGILLNLREEVGALPEEYRLGTVLYIVSCRREMWAKAVSDSRYYPHVYLFVVAFLEFVYQKNKNSEVVFLWGYTTDQADWTKPRFSQTSVMDSFLHWILQLFWQFIDTAKPSQWVRPDHKVWSKRAGILPWTPLKVAFTSVLFPERPTTVQRLRMTSGIQVGRCSLLISHASIPKAHPRFRGSTQRMWEEEPPRMVESHADLMDLCVAWASQTSKEMQ